MCVKKASFPKERRREVVFPFALRRVTFRHVAERSVAWSSSRSSGADMQKELTVKTNNMPAAMSVVNATAPSEAAPRKAERSCDQHEAERRCDWQPRRNATRETAAARHVRAQRPT